MKDVILHGAIAEVADEFSHPGLKRIRVVYCDDQPNDNGQGILKEDFADIKQSILNTPFKMNFINDGPTGHAGSIPIGFINNAFEDEKDGINRLIVDGILFKHEYPTEVDYIEKSFAEGNPPSISFEMGYKNSVVKDGVEWLKGLIARAATFVKFPAYGNRTAILALASRTDIDLDMLGAVYAELVEAATWSSTYVNSLPDSSFACVDKNGRHYPYKDAEGTINLPHLRAALSRIGDPSNVQCGKDKLEAAAKEMKIGAYADINGPKINDKGGSNRMEEELKNLKAQLETLQAQIAEKESVLAENATKIQELTDKVSTLETSLAEKDSTITEFTNKETVAKRKAELAAAEITIDINDTRLLKMDDEAFAEYVTDLKAATEAAKASKKIAIASSRGTPVEIPKFDVSGDAGKSAVGIAERLRSYARTKEVAATE